MVCGQQVPISVAIIEDNAAYRETLRVVLEGSVQFRCLRVYPNAEEAIRSLPLLTPDVILVDLELPGQSGVHCIRELKLRKISSRFVVLTNFDDIHRIFAAIRAGAIGYLLKRSSLPEILAGIEQAHGGGAPMTPHIARLVLESFHTSEVVGAYEPLTKREKEVLELARAGRRYRQIADKLGISYDTVRTHFNNIYEKLHVHSKAEAIDKFSKI